MAVIPNMREYVRRPGSLTPRYGLFAVAQAMGTLVEGMPMPVHAGQGGLEYETAVCDLPTCYETNCIDTLGTKPAGETTTLVQADPFVVLTSLSCGSVGLTEDRMRRFLLERAIAGEQTLVEQTFSEGACGQSPSLADATALAATTDVVDAISLLESTYYAANGLPAVIHVPTLAGAYLSQSHVIWRDAAGIWRTAQGSYVSIGNYTPFGAAAATFYITSQVSIWRTTEAEVFYTPFEAALNRSTNQVNAFREREYIVAYECEAWRTDVTLVVT